MCFIVTFLLVFVVFVLEYSLFVLGIFFLFSFTLGLKCVIFLSTSPFTTPFTHFYLITGSFYNIVSLCLLMTVKKSLLFLFLDFVFF
uniref:Uncharacterized protein n=1 Tax=Anopheles dirus TaxID=7168 RepID=A0A182NXS2_9DIPT